MVCGGGETSNCYAKVYGGGKGVKSSNRQVITLLILTDRLP